MGTLVTQYLNFFLGPAKANRLFGLVPVSHEDALVFGHSNNLDITFRMTRALTDFMATLHKNGTGMFRINDMKNLLQWS